MHEARAICFLFGILGTFFQYEQNISLENKKRSKAVNFLFLKIFIVIIIIIFISFLFSLSFFTLRLQYTFSSVSRTSDLARPV